MAMLTWLDTPTCAIVLYALAGTTALLLGVVEQRRGGAADPSRWPTFWFATGVLLLLMTAGRASDLSHLLTDIGRDQARLGGWYETRRSLQAWLVGAVASMLVVAVAFAVWRVPGLRWRYLPPAVVVFTLVCFAGVRSISLHQVDALLHNRSIGGVSVGAIIEVGLLLLVLVVSAWRFPRSSHERSDEPAEPLAGI